MLIISYLFKTYAPKACQIASYINYAAITDVTNKIRLLGLIWGGENDIYIALSILLKVTLQLSVMRPCMSAVIYFYEHDRVRQSNKEWIKLVVVAMRLKIGYQIKIIYECPLLRWKLAVIKSFIIIHGMIST